MDLLDSAAHWLGTVESGRWDAWENARTGFGTQLDKTVGARYATFTGLGDNELEALYHGDDMAARIIDEEPEQMLRKGFEIKSDDDETEQALLSEFERLELVQKTLEAACWGRLYGKSALILGADDGRPANTPFVPERVRSVEWSLVIDRRYFSPNQVYESGPKAGQPATYYVTPPSGTIVGIPFEIHESRMTIFGGARTTFTERLRRNYCDHSVLQRPYEVIRAFAAGFKSVEILLSDGPQAVYSIDNLASLIGAGNKSKLEQRIQIIEMFRSAMRAIVIDAKTEKFERQTANFSGVDAILDRLMLRMAAAARMPATLLMGQSPAGMNATGDSDFRQWYDRIESSQLQYLKPRMLGMLRVIAQATDGPIGSLPKKLDIKFCPLQSPTPAELATARQATMTADVAAIDAGIVMPEEVALSRAEFMGWTEFDRGLRATALDVEKSRASDDSPTNPDLVTPTDRAAVVTVDEARNAAGLGPDPDPKIGALKIAEYRALQEAQATPAADEIAVPEPEPAPAVAPGPFGAKKPGPFGAQ